MPEKLDEFNQDPAENTQEDVEFELVEETPNSPEEDTEKLTKEEAVEIEKLTEEIKSDAEVIGEIESQLNSGNLTDSQKEELLGAKEKFVNFFKNNVSELTTLASGAYMAGFMAVSEKSLSHGTEAALILGFTVALGLGSMSVLNVLDNKERSYDDLARQNSKEKAESKVEEESSNELTEKEVLETEKLIESLQSNGEEIENIENKLQEGNLSEPRQKELLGIKERFSNFIKINLSETVAVLSGTTVAATISGMLTNFIPYNVAPHAMIFALLTALTTLISYVSRTEKLDRRNF